MVDGLRDAFPDNDVIGNINAGVTPLVGRTVRTPRRKSKRHRKKSHSKRHTVRRNRKRRHSRHRRHNTRTSGKVHYTRNGQPYIKLASGKCRFIKGRRRK